MTSVMEAAAALTLASAAEVRADCDMLDGPVVQDARRALESKDVTATLSRVRPGAEGEIREAFRQALAVRGLGPEARALADRSFFETLVRVHREGEERPCTGLAPAAPRWIRPSSPGQRRSRPDPWTALVATIVTDVEHGLRERFAQANGARCTPATASRSPSYVAAYVELMQLRQRLRGTRPRTPPGEHKPATAHAH